MTALRPEGDTSALRESQELTRLGGAAETVDLTLDAIFEVLKNQRRRHTLAYLHENGEEATLGPLAEHIAALENDTTPQRITSTQRKRAYVSLYQNHLPKMADVGVVDFDKKRGTIELLDAARVFDPYLEDDPGPHWYRLYGAVTIVGIGAFVASVAGGAAVGLTPLTVLGGVLAAVGVCSLFHAWVESGRRARSGGSGFDSERDNPA